MVDSPQVKESSVKNPRYNKRFCPCCGHKKRHMAQLQLYRNILTETERNSYLPVSVASLKAPDWKPDHNPAWDKVYSKPEDGGWRTRQQIERDNRARTIRRRNARNRKLLRQTGQIPYQQ